MNVVFELQDPSLESEFLVQAERCGMRQIQNHPLAGGMRVTLYNMIPESYFTALTDFMTNFMAGHRI